MNRYRIYDSIEMRYLHIGYDTLPSAQRACKKMNGETATRYKVRDTKPQRRKF